MTLGIAAPAQLVEQRRSPYQTIEIAEHPVFGRQLYIDDDLQISASDQVYGAAMVAPLLQKSPLTDVLILGGGDGGVLAEVIAAHQRLGRKPPHTRMVEIDREVVDLCETHLPELSQSVYDHPAASLEIGDAFAALDQARDLDAVIYDLTFDPVRDTQSHSDFVDATIAKAATALAPGGVLSMQCCGTGATTDGNAEQHAALQDRIRQAAERHLGPASEQAVYIPSYEGLWVFLAATKA